MYDYFGLSVAVSGDTVVVGAIGEDSSSTGVNSVPNELASAAGAAYVFTGLGLGPSLALAPDGGGGYFIRFAGHADLSYRLLRASDPSGPWPGIATNSAPPSGLVEFHDTLPPPDRAFYRVRCP